MVAASGDTGRRLRGTPSLVIEVADASTRRYNRTLKLDLYRQRGVPSCWLIDPDTATIEAYDLVADAYLATRTVSGKETFTATQPFPVAIQPAELIDPPGSE